MSPWTLPTPDKRRREREEKEKEVRKGRRVTEKQEEKVSPNGQGQSVNLQQEVARNLIFLKKPLK